MNIVEQLTGNLSLVLGAALLDYGIGDPWHWLHPVQVMGSWITWGHRYSHAWFPAGWPRRLAGVGLTITTMGGSALVAWGLIDLTTRLHPVLGWLVAVVMLASCFAARSLNRAAMDVVQPLSQGSIVEARSRLKQYVGRDTDNLSEPEILRAVVETVAENTTDGVTGPLFFALLGWWTGLGAVPLAMAYKAASTLDSMVGYRREPYTDIGWFSAQFEDRLTWLPCRLTVAAIAILSGRPLQVWRLCCRDAPQDPSPNSGWSECAYAAALGVQLGGDNYYQGQLRTKPLLGDPDTEVTVETVQQALRLLRWVCFVWLGLGAILPGCVGLWLRFRY